MSLAIGKGLYVCFSYELRDQAGDLLDSSDISGPITYIHGFKSLLLPLEEGLQGRIQDEHFRLKIAPELAYGPYKADAVLTVPKSQFKHPEYLELGLQFEWAPEETAATDKAVEKILVFIKDIQENFVILDANHPLAGKELNFDIHILTVREPTAEELDAIK
jgi:FKBP-type peptidyl-prolyl cis-trans isomerase SlyD